MSRGVLFDTRDTSTKFEYPHLLLEGVLIVQELEHLGDIVVNDGGKMPLYVKVGNDIEHLGYGSLTAQYITSLVSIGKRGYKLSVVKDRDTVIPLNLDDAYSIISLFIYQE